MTAIIAVLTAAAIVLALYAAQLRVERNDANAALARIELLPDDEPATFLRVHVGAVRTAVDVLREWCAADAEAAPDELLAEADDALVYLEERLRTVPEGVEL